MPSTCKGANWVVCTGLPRMYACAFRALCFVLQYAHPRRKVSWQSFAFASSVDGLRQCERYSDCVEVTGWENQRSVEIHLQTYDLLCMLDQCERAMLSSSTCATLF